MPLPVPPLLPSRPSLRTVHGETFEDEYEWVRLDRDAAMAHLREENAYADAVTARLGPLRQRIFDEIKARSTDDETSVPYDFRGHWYYYRRLKGQQFKCLYRCPVVPGGRRPHVTPDPLPGEELILDGNRRAQETGSSYYVTGTWDVPPDGSRLVCSFDVTGDEEYQIRVTDIATGEVLDDAIRGAARSVQFLADGQRFLYVRNDHAWRPCEVWSHRVGTSTDEDVLLYREEDERFRLDVWADFRCRQLMIASGSTRTSESMLVDATADVLTPRVVLPREEGVTYDMDVWGEGEVVVVHDRDHPNGSLAILRDDGSGWRELLPGSDARRIWQVSAFRDHLVLDVTQDARDTLLVFPRVRTPEGSVLGEGYMLDPGRDVYTAALGSNRQFETNRALVRVESMTVPTTWYELDMDTRGLELVRQDPVPGHDPAAYREWREWAVAPDGTRIPMSFAARADVRPDGTAPALLYGYGAYDITIEPEFEPDRLSLLDRGVVYAVAHVRGGGELGRAWWEAGSMANKANSFTDFLACAEHLVSSGWADPARIAAEGASAGGLLVGAAVNLDPSRFAVVLAGVPFVDITTTMLDADAPLTVGEWEEWGNPVESAADYRRLAGYSPYENVRAGRYPAMVVTTSLNDQRVSYVEPVKWVARLRATTEADPERPVLLRCSMAAGHDGPAGRFDAWRESAWEWAVVLDRLGAGDGVYPQG